MSKSFISILGTNDYLECCHSFNGQESSEPVKYVQEDLIKFLCKDFTKQDEIRIFLTNEAKSKNWDDDGHNFSNEKLNNNIGLRRRLENMNLRCEIKPIEIKDGLSESEIWEIFQSIFDSFKEGEEVIVDITHSFRTLPMLMITLLNFAKQLKKIKVAGIYYAAFESLGAIQQIKKIPADERIVPILNLTAFSHLQEWTNATYDFINNLNIKSLKKLIKENKNISKKSKTPKDISDALNELNQKINDILICRGNAIFEYDFNLLKENILKLKEQNIDSKPFKALIDKLHEKIAKFSNTGINNLLYAIELSIEHGYYQQAITMLQETIVTAILINLGYDINERNYRQLVNRAFHIKKNDIPQEKWKDLSKEEKEVIKKIINCNLLSKSVNEFDYLTDIRNDINHGGFSNIPKKPESIIARLNNSFNNICPLLRSSLGDL